MPDCPFCAEPAALAGGIELHNALAYIREDKYSVSPGHLLIIPRRHVEDWFSLTPDEQAAISQLINQAKTWLDESYVPAGYNIGMNCGEAAGQTVPHMHCHLIPRYEGDVEDPRGGVRWVKADKTGCWSWVYFVFQWLAMNCMNRNYIANDSMKENEFEVWS